MKLYAETNEATPAIQILKDDDPAPEGYTEITEIEPWESYGARQVGAFTWFRDYKVLREELKIRINDKAGFDPADPDTYNPTNWSKLTAAEQEIAARYFLVPEPFRSTVYTMTEQISLGASFHANACAARDQRYRQAMAELYCRLSIADACDTQGDLNQVPKGSTVSKDQDDKLTVKVKAKTLGDSYRACGIEGTIEDGAATIGLFDYLLSRVGTPFEGNGFASKDYPVVGFDTCADLADHLFAILSRGEY